jgi:PAS domain S-box-containing protein
LYNLFEIIFNSVNDGIVFYDYNGYFLEVNPTTCDYLGYSRDELLQMNVLDIIPSELRKDLNRQVAEKYNQKSSLIETICRCKDGSLLPIELNIIPTTYQEKEAKLAVVRDITERKKTEEALKQNEQMYRQAYALMQGVVESPKDVVIFALDKDYRYITFNKNHQMTMENIWGANIEIGVSMLDYIKTPVDVEKAKANFDRVLAGEAFTVVEEYGDSSLERCWYENVYSPLEDEEGSIIGLTLFLTDITERKENEMTLVRAKLLAEEASRTKSEFLANMSHELRTPLNSVIGFSEVMISGACGDLNEKQMNYVSNILTSGNHLLGVITDILDISKIESGSMKYEPERINLKELMDEIKMLMEPMSKKKFIDFKYNINLENPENGFPNCEINNFSAFFLSKLSTFFSS